MNVTITNAQPRDADQLVAHQQQLIMEPGAILRPTPQIPTSFNPEHTRLMVQETRDRIARITAAHDALMLVAHVDHQIVGIVELETRPPQTPAGAAAVSLSVAQHMRRRGIAHALLTAAIDWARAHDKIDRLTLSVMTANAPALHLYRKHGFQTPRKPYTLPQYPDTQLVTMTLPLNT